MSPMSVTGSLQDVEIFSFTRQYHTFPQAVQEMLLTYAPKNTLVSL